MSARHVRRPGQPRRSWAPLDGEITGVLLDLTPDAQVMSSEQVQAVRDQFGDELWADTRDTLGVSDALVRLAPRLGARR